MVPYIRVTSANSPFSIFARFKSCHIVWRGGVPSNRLKNSNFFLNFYLYLYSKYDWTWNPYRIFLWDYSYKNARRFHNLGGHFLFM